MRGNLGLSPNRLSLLDLLKKVLSFAFSLLSSSANFLFSLLMILLIISLSFCLVPSMSSSEDLPECIGGDIHACVGHRTAHVLYGSLCICGLGADGDLDVCGGPKRGRCRQDS